MNKIMMLKANSPALHKLGDIGSLSYDEKINIHKEDDDYYIGQFCEGLGYIDVKFKKEDCRSLTPDERNKYNGTWYTINGTPLYKNYIDEEGNVAKYPYKKSRHKIEVVLERDRATEKQEGLKGLVVNIYKRDVEVGNSLVGITDDGRYWATSKIRDVEEDSYGCWVITQNSVYRLSRVREESNDDVLLSLQVK